MLMKFEWACEKREFSLESWPYHLLTLLPDEAADTITLLDREETKKYDKVKSCLLRKYRLSTEEFQRKFRDMEKDSNESYIQNLL